MNNSLFTINSFFVADPWFGNSIVRIQLNCRPPSWYLKNWVGGRDLHPLELLQNFRGPPGEGTLNKDLRRGEREPRGQVSQERKQQMQRPSPEAGTCRIHSRSPRTGQFSWSSGSHMVNDEGGQGTTRRLDACGRGGQLPGLWLLY